MLNETVTEPDVLDERLEVNVFKGYEPAPYGSVTSHPTLVNSAPNSQDPRSPLSSPPTSREAAGSAPSRPAVAP